MVEVEAFGEPNSIDELVLNRVDSEPDEAGRGRVLKDDSGRESGG